MSIATVIPFVTAVSVLVGLALLVLVGSVGIAATQFFMENRPVRIARREPVLSYYRHLALGH